MQRMLLPLKRLAAFFAKFDWSMHPESLPWLRPSSPASSSAAHSWPGNPPAIQTPIPLCYSLEPRLLAVPLQLLMLPMHHISFSIIDTALLVSNMLMLRLSVQPAPSFAPHDRGPARRLQGLGPANHNLICADHHHKFQSSLPETVSANPESEVSRAQRTHPK